MKKLDFTKMHGAGNDFILVKRSDLDKNNIIITKEFVQKICNRHFGIGSDGFIIVDKGKKEDFKFTIYNPDGSLAEISGNGIMCYMKYLIDKNLTKNSIINVETLNNVLKLEVQNDVYTLPMGKPEIIKELAYDVKNLGDNFLIKIEDKIFKFTPVRITNPHCVIFLKVSELKSFDIEKYGKSIEQNTEIFPNKTNVEFVEQISDSEINMRAWGRGIGESLASGSGACASVIVGILSGVLKKDQFIKVNLAGGVLEVKWSGNKKDSVFMRGKVEINFEGFYFLK